ncbi:MAG: hypothetical protein H6559_37045 [Lewinellaceae bacterium]|nr:hypothetical protein [Lewinellaceae bacterium]
MDHDQLLELKVTLKRLLADNEITATLQKLAALIPAAHNAKYNTLILFQRDFKVIKGQQQKGLHSADTLSRKQSAFLDNLINFIDDLALEDLYPGITPEKEGRQKGRKSKTGSVLYAIPHKMEIEEEQKCTVRLAFDESYLADEMFPGTDVSIRALRRIGSRMEVEVVDPGAEPVFSVRTISSPVQIVEEDDFTEWIYFVKPLKEGVHELWLKVIIITWQEGEKIKKDIVLQEKIEVVAHPVEEEEISWSLRHSGLIFTLGGPSVGGLEGGTDGSPGTEAAEAVLTGAAGGSAGFLSTTLSKIAALAGAAALIGGLWYGAQSLGELENTAGVLITPAETEQAGNEEVVAGRAVLAKLSEVTPARGVEFAPHVFRIDPGRDTTLFLPSGSFVVIPAHTIAGPSGERLSGEVEVHVREIRKAHEVIASGIPMRYYNQHKQEEWFQTAGMFEVRAFRDGEPLKVAEGKAIEVNLVSDADGPYDFWEFDPAIGNWVKRAAGNVPARSRMPGNKLSREIEQLKRELSVPLPKPKQYEVYEYDVADIDISCCPELRPIAGKIYLTHGGDEPALAREKHEPWLSKRRWLSRTLKRMEPGGRVYEFKWMGDTTFTTYVTPPPKSTEIDAAFALYDSLMEINKKKRLVLQRKEEMLDQQYAFRRSVQVEGFGIYNFDILWKREDMVVVAAEFGLEGLDEELRGQVMAYLITGGQRTVIKFPPHAWKDFRFSPRDDNQLVVLLPDGEVGVFRQKHFDRALNDIRSAAENGTPYVFDLDILKGEIRSAEDLQQIIEYKQEDS